MAPALAALGELAEELRGNPEALLSLLRELEALHRDVQDGPFRQSLPENRQKLFTLLQSMEKNGGWPYIPRLQLRTFIDLLGQGVHRLSSLIRGLDQGIEQLMERESLSVTGISLCQPSPRSQPPLGWSPKP